jgi:hypothetical protein
MHSFKYSHRFLFCIVLIVLWSNLSTYTTSAENGIFANGDFESGDLTGWIVEGNATVIQDELDTLTDNSLHKVGEGMFSAQIGDSTPWGNQGPQRSSISQEVIVPSLNEQNRVVIQFSYAVVANDPPSHYEQDKPLFWITVRDLTTDEAIYDTDIIYTSQTSGEWYLGSDPNETMSQRGFSYLSSDRWVFKPWQSVEVDLSDRVGNHIRLEFVVRDCNLSAHAAYGYLDDIHIGKPKPAVLPPLEGNPQLAPFIKPTLIGHLFRTVEKLRLWPWVLCCIPLLPLLLIAMVLSRRKRSSSTNLPAYTITSPPSEDEKIVITQKGGGGFRPPEKETRDQSSSGGFRPG